MKQGNIQVTFKATESTKEKNIVHPFRGIIGLIKVLYKQYKAHPQRVIIFFDPKKAAALFFPLLMAINSMAQDCDNFPAIGLSYLTPKSVMISGEYYTEMGLTAGIGVAANKPDKYPRKNLPDSIGNSLDIFVMGGYRVYRIDYAFSLFLNAGFNMGNVHSLQPLLSAKFLFPIKETRFSTSVEPLYIFGKGILGRLSFHVKL